MYNHLKSTQIVRIYIGLKIESNLQCLSFRYFIHNDFEGCNRVPSSLPLQIFGIIWNFEDQNNKFEKSDEKTLLGLI